MVFGKKYLSPIESMVYAALPNFGIPLAIIVSDERKKRKRIRS